jgi:hypothetical protein
MRKTLLGLLFLGPALLAPLSAAEKETQKFSELPAKEGCTRLYLFRPKHFMGSGIKPYVKIDGVEVGRLVGGNCVAVYLRPGMHSIETKLSWTNLPIKGGTVQLRIPEKADELYLQYMADVKFISASQYTISAQYSTGFLETEIAYSKATIQNLVPLPVSPTVLLDAKP